MSIIGSIAGIGGSIINGIQGASAAGKASDALAQGATKSEAIIDQRVNNAQGQMNNIWGADQARQNPYLDLGSTSAMGLQGLLSKGFTAPTLQEAEQTPGYQFTLQQGTNAIDENAAANGTLNSGNTGKALTDYGQGLASTTYQQVYNNALQGYMANLQGLTTGTGIGENAATSLGQQGGVMSGQTANLQLQGGEAAAQQNNNIAEARASGYLGKSAAYSGMIGGITGALGGGGFNLGGLFGGGGGSSTVGQGPVPLYG